jgi:ABC-type spermidine/putrescine transport system permease subunit I
MTHRDFLQRLGLVAAGCLLLAAGLRLGLGESWFSFYGWATVGLATTPFLTALLWRRLPEKGWSRWWSLLIGLPVFTACLLQIGFWYLFFSQGGSNPTFGVAREMLRPVLDGGLPYLLAAISLTAIWLIGVSATATSDEH